MGVEKPIPGWKQTRMAMVGRLPSHMAGYSSGGGGGGVIRRRHLRGDVPLDPCYKIMVYSYYPEIINHVLTLQLGINIELRRIAMYLANTEQKPTFAALAQRINETTCLLFASGKMVITGGKTYHGSKLAAHRHRLAIESVPHPVLEVVSAHTGRKGSRVVMSTLAGLTHFGNLNIENIVGSGCLSTTAIDLRKLNDAYPVATRWDPEIFPALIFNVTRTFCPLQFVDRCTALVYDTGKVVTAGANNKEDIYLVHECLKVLVQPYGDLAFPIRPEHRFAYRKAKILANITYADDSVSNGGGGGGGGDYYDDDAATNRGENGDGHDGGGDNDAAPRQRVNELSVWNNDALDAIGKCKSLVAVEPEPEALSVMGVWEITREHCPLMIAERCTVDVYGAGRIDRITGTDDDHDIGLVRAYIRTVYESVEFVAAAEIAALATAAEIEAMATAAAGVT
jgi:transcription initiation factor TFIID TATA-box-binding protein